MWVEISTRDRIGGLWQNLHRKLIGDHDRLMGQCQAAVAQAVDAFGRIDILLCCTSQGML